jgi:hypothetical protein
MAKSDGLSRAVSALAGAGGVAHVVFLTTFGLRFVKGDGFRVWNGLLALLAVVGFVANLVGWAMLKHGGNRAVSNKTGVYALALSTVLAGLLLVAS